MALCRLSQAIPKAGLPSASDLSRGLCPGRQKVPHIATRILGPEQGRRRLLDLIESLRDTLKPESSNSYNECGSLGAYLS